MARFAPGSGTTAPPGQDDDICPVCKSSRYLNPNMRFLVNPECYHKMCESCVDRIFSTGPAPCPVAGCARTLRKQRFRKQTFEDLHIEREVDIRRRVAAVFNRREEEFTTLLAYNNYLEDVESLTFNLLNNISVPETEAKLAAYAARNSSSIAHNASLSTQETQTSSAALAAQKEQSLLSREAARREAAEEKQEREEGRREVLDRLASGGDADKIVREGQKVVLKKSTARRSAASKAHTAAAPPAIDGPAAVFEIQGLKPIAPPEPERAYDPFGGLSVRHEYYDFKGRNYEHPWLEQAGTDQMVTTGGYDVGEYCARAMMEAFAGLGVFVGEEVAGGEGGGEVATVGAAAVAGE